MSTTTTLTIVLGSYGQLLRSGPWLDEDGAERDMSGSTVTARFYPPNGAASFDRVGTATGAYLYYRIADGDIATLGSWGVRLFHGDADENLPSERLQLQVVSDT